MRGFNLYKQFQNSKLIGYWSDWKTADWSMFESWEFLGSALAVFISLKLLKYGKVILEWGG